MIKKLLIPILAIIVIAGLELYAIGQGINGTALSLAIGAIGAIATGGTLKVMDHIKVNMELKRKKDSG